MKILYVGHYNESSGWGQVARDYILALDRVGVDVVPRSIDLGLANFEVPSRIKELEFGDPSGSEVIIQHVLPHYMKYDSSFKNIGIFEIETKNIEHTKWANHLNIMDELWVPCTDMMDLKLRPPIKLVPHTCDIAEFEKGYLPLNIEPLKNKFVFYYIGQYNRRKHITAILRAFHNEFDPSEPVELVLKVNRPGMNADELAKEMYNLTQTIKQNLRLYNNLDRYKKEVIITLNLPREELLRLHVTCNCFVSASFGEAWNLGAFDAMAMGNLVVASNTGGPKDFLDPSYLVDGSYEPVFGEHDTFPSFGTARELEFDISISDLQKKMRVAYNANGIIRKRNMETARMYDYEIIGGKMKELLYA